MVSFSYCSSSTAMGSATLLTLSPSSSSSSSSSSSFPKPNTFTPKLSVRNPKGNALCTSSQRLGSKVAEKLNGLASEFISLSEPIDRVKRLLHYASLLPPLDNSDRVPANRVAGCTTQVWVVAEMDDVGRMRFRADSDSEISKGFCWCLVWMLDGAEPHEVLMVNKDHLADINVGFNLKAHSRVNTWHNVLFRMQNVTKDLLLLPHPTIHGF